MHVPESAHSFSSLPGQNRAEDGETYTGLLDHNPVISYY